MFSNIGHKIKVLAKLITWVGIVASVISGIVMMSGARTSISMYGIQVQGGMAWGGILTIVLGSLASWASSFILYGFGDLVETAQKIADSQERRG